MKAVISPTLLEKFNAKVSFQDSGCWTCAGRSMLVNGKLVKLKRVSLQLAGIELKSSDIVRTVCGTSGCVNPQHLRVSRTKLPKGNVRYVQKRDKLLIIDEDLLARLREKVLIQETGCHYFTGNKTRDGHGQIHVRVKDQSGTNMEYVHRVSLMLQGTSVPDDCEVCHRCNNASCINPEHLYIGNRMSNMHDMATSGAQKGENNPACKLSEAKCGAIRWLRSEGFGLRDIAFLFDCRESTVSRIANNKRRQQPAPEKSQ